MQILFNKNSSQYLNIYHVHFYEGKYLIPSDNCNYRLLENSLSNFSIMFKR
jgi:hypothetical protein